MGREGADRMAVDETEPHLVRSVSLTAEQDPVAGQGLGIRIVFGRLLLLELEGRISRTEGVQVGLGQPAPPGFVLKTQRPRSMGLCEPDQAVAAAFCWG